ncbi:MAG: hypothetical protein ACKOWF_10995 [Chloroflexota bacterium]
MAAAGLLVAFRGAGAAAQDAPGREAGALLRAFGRAEATVTAGPDGPAAPAQLAAGPVLVSVSAPAPWVAYVALVRPPAGMADDEAARLALAAAREDLPAPDWVYFGGATATAPGGSAVFAADLAPGEYRWAVSWYADGPGGEEQMRLLPLAVTGESAGAGIPFAVDLVAADGPRFLVAPDPAPAGPAVWRFLNASEGAPAPHHAVLWRAPEGVTAQAIVEEFGALALGTPVPESGVIAGMAWAGFFAMQSPGTATWAEVDLAPGTHAVTSFVVDPGTGRPQVLDGLAVVFEVA